MSNLLAKIYQHKLIEVRNRKKLKSLQDICRDMKCANNKPKDFFGALQKKSCNNQTALICEIKKASPSKGIIRENFNAAEIAKTYKEAGATCLSVLTDQKYFMGNDDDLIKARQAIDLPILRKDFMIDTYQIYEAKFLGADCILLIVAMLDDSKLQELEECALSLGLSILIEVHNEAELMRALKLKSKLIGINNRDLKSLQVDINNAVKLSHLVPEDCVLVGESGIHSKEDLLLLKNSHINCFLIGEYFMKQDDIKKAVQTLL